MCPLLQCLALMQTFLFVFCSGIEVKYFKIYRLGDENNLGTGSDVAAVNAEDFVLVKPKSAIDKPLPRKLSVCFNMFYIAMDYWSRNPKTILRIFGENDDPFSTSYFLRVISSAPSGKIALNSGALRSGEFGDFRYEDLAFQRWSAICISLDFNIAHVVYYIDGRKVGDQGLPTSFKTLFNILINHKPTCPSNFFLI